MRSPLRRSLSAKLLAAELAGIVAGSTTSAISAVSVMNCSCTQTNRSSRAKPRLTFSWSGHTDTGLVFWITIAATGGPFFSAASSPSRISPTRDWSSMRTHGSRNSCPSIIDLFQ